MQPVKSNETALNALRTSAQGASLSTSDAVVNSVWSYHRCSRRWWPRFLEALGHEQVGPLGGHHEADGSG